MTSPVAACSNACLVPGSDYSQFEIKNALLDRDGYALVDASATWTG